MKVLAPSMTVSWSTPGLAISTRISVSVSRRTRSGVATGQLYDVFNRSMMPSVVPAFFRLENAVVVEVSDMFSPYAIVRAHVATCFLDQTRSPCDVYKSLLQFMIKRQ